MRKRTALAGAGGALLGGVVALRACVAWRRLGRAHPVVVLASGGTGGALSDSDRSGLLAHRTASSRQRHALASTRLYALTALLNTPADGAWACLPAVWHLGAPNCTGHIYPAMAVAEEIRRQHPDTAVRLSHCPHLAAW